MPDRSSDPAADFESWVSARGPALMRMGYLLTGAPADADDVVHEALARALPRWSQISRMEDVDAYVRRMIVNEHTSRWRRFRKRESPVAHVGEQFPGRVLADPTDACDEHARLWEACRALPEIQRTAVVLRFYEQLEYAEIADLGPRRPCRPGQPVRERGR